MNSGVSVSRLRGIMDDKLARGMDAAYRWLLEELRLGESAARQLTDHLAGARAALGRIPTRQDVVFERFFDEAGDQHLVLHSPFGSRINRAWGLALRKRFCRQFNFELQAAALDDSIVISLGAIHSFPLEDVTRYLKSAGVRDMVTQALLATPMFPTHWRWNATTSLAVRRNNGGQKVPAQFQRSDAEDLMAVVFPDQLACQDNLIGEREIPRHPLVEQTIDDCLNSLMDIAGLEEVLHAYEDGQIRFHCRDLGGPLSPGAGNPERPSVRIPGRCAGGRTPHEHGDGQAFPGPCRRRAAGPVEPGCHRPGTQRSLARIRQPG